jgi:hypothetical protein
MDPNYPEPAETTSPAGVSETAQSVATVLPEMAGRVCRLSGWRFVRHVLEMILAMAVGMVALGAAIGALGEPPGYSNPLVEYGFMGASMSVSMVAWMRFRGHAWSGGLEMTAAMLVPMFAVVIPFGLGAIGETPGRSDHALMMLAHVAMVGGMVALMIYRRDLYAHGAFSKRK